MYKIVNLAASVQKQAQNTQQGAKTLILDNIKHARFIRENAFFKQLTNKWYNNKQ